MSLSFRTTCASLVLAATVASSAQAALILTNPGFEDTPDFRARSTNGEPTSGSFSGWTWAANAGFSWIASRRDLSGVTVTEGTNAIYFEGIIVQTAVADRPGVIPGNPYRLQFDYEKNVAVTSQPTITGLLNWYDASGAFISSNQRILTTSSGTLTSPVSLLPFTFIVDAIAPANAATVGVELRVAGSRTWFDNVRIQGEPIPEPTTLSALVCAGVIALRRRRN
jgi:hypothetical protein